MKRVLCGLKPEKVFSIFEDICAIPHGSGNTKAISDYCINFARELGLWCYQDELNNVIIKKPASNGYEAHEPVVLQGHLDMVCEKDAGCDFDFEHDSLHLKTDGEHVFAEGTTLGADDGVAIAMALSILEDNTLKTPPLEVIFTTDEETGMYGANALDVSHITAKRFINIDSENEGVFTVGCAGGCRVDIKLPVETENNKKQAYSVEISGLKGGHSGTEINKGRLNANKLLGLFLNELKNVKLYDISGGMKDNAITTSATCIITSDSDVFSAADLFEKKNRINTDFGLTVTVKECYTEKIYNAESSTKIIDLLVSLPYGVQSMSKDIAGLVQTSLNIGIVKSEEKSFSVSLSVRSSKYSEKISLIQRLAYIAELYCAQFSTRGNFAFTK